MCVLDFTLQAHVVGGGPRALSQRAPQTVLWRFAYTPRENLPGTFTCFYLPPVPGPRETHSLSPTHLSQEAKEFNLVRKAIDTIFSLTYIIFSQVTLKTHIHKIKLESTDLLSLSLVV